MDLAIVERTSEEFLSQWHRLVSTTNWEKGRIIQEWRTTLIESGAAPADYSDETWSRRLGNVTPQHVGRLRRVFERFSLVRDEYSGLYWSHFQAALDWDDAPMWLEGAVQSDWSIAEMRRTRAESLGMVEDLDGADAAQAAVETVDEDAELEPYGEGMLSAEHTNGVASGENPWDGKEISEGSETNYAEAESDSGADILPYDEANLAEQAEPVRPFAGLASLPTDASEAFEAFKLCILKHRLAGWVELAREDLVSALDSLKELALAPAST